MTIREGEEMDTRKEYYRLRKKYDKELPKRCCNCSSTENLTIHHIVPLASGGTNNISNLVRICGECHSKIHGHGNTSSSLIKKGIKKAQKRGVVLGRPEVPESKTALALKLYDEGEHTVKEITEIAGISRKTVYNKLEQRELQQKQEEVING